MPIKSLQSQEVPPIMRVAPVRAGHEGGTRTAPVDRLLSEACRVSVPTREPRPSISGTIAHLRGGTLMTDFFIHIGYPKAASTSLQVHYFSRHPDLRLHIIVS